MKQFSNPFFQKSNPRQECYQAIPFKILYPCTSEERIFSSSESASHLDDSLLQNFDNQDLRKRFNSQEIDLVRYKPQITYQSNRVTEGKKIQPSPLIKLYNSQKVQQQTKIINNINKNQRASTQNFTKDFSKEKRLPTQNKENMNNNRQLTKVRYEGAFLAKCRFSEKYLKNTLKSISLYNINSKQNKKIDILDCTRKIEQLKKLQQLLKKSLN